MKKIYLLPLSGIEIENTGKVSLGQGKHEIEQLLGRPAAPSNEKQYYYDELECRIDFDKKGNVEFIEFIYGPYPEKTELSIYGINPFQIGAKNLLEILTEKNNGATDTSEADFAYCFLEISAGIWRQFSEISVQEDIDQMKHNGTYTENEAWLLEDLEKSKNFWTIGLGVKDYYQL